MSTIIPVSRGARIYGADPDPKATDVVSIDATRINPDTDTTLIDDSAIPLTLSLGGANRVLTKNIKLMTGAGATINTGAGTILLDSDNTEVDVVYSSAQNAWKSNPAGMIIPITQTRAFIISSGAVASASFNSDFVNQGAPNSVSISLNGRIAASGGSGFGSLAVNTGSGIVWVLERDGFEWIERHRLFSPLNGAVRFGTGVSTSADARTIIAGAPGYDEGGAIGAIIAHEYDDVRLVYNTTTPYMIPQPPTILGSIYEYAPAGGIVKLSGDGNTLVIGCSTYSLSGLPPASYLWVYQKNPTTNVWTFFQRIDAMSFIGDLFGWGMDISADGSTIVAGSPFYGGGFPGGGDGAVASFSRTNIPLNQITKITVVGVNTFDINGAYFMLPTNANSAFPPPAPASHFSYIWYNTGASADPMIAGATGFQVDISSITLPDDAAVAAATNAVINSMDIYRGISSQVLGNVLTLLYAFTYTQPGITDGATPTNFIFEVDQYGAPANHFTRDNVPLTTGTNQYGRSAAVNANGTVMVVSSLIYVQILRRTLSPITPWVVDFTYYMPSSGDKAVDINSKGNVVMAGSSDELSNEGVVYVFANTDGTWKLKSGPFSYKDISNPIIFTPFQFGSDVSISGDGALAMVGGQGLNDPTLGIKYVWSIETSGVSVAVGDVPRYFYIRSPVQSLFKYMVWYKTKSNMSPPPFNPPIFPSQIQPQLQIDVYDLSLPSQNNILVQRTVSAINSDPRFREIVTASGSETMITITSMFSGTLGGVYDASDDSPPIPFYPTNYTFTLITAGQAPPVTGAIWSLG